MFEDLDGNGVQDVYGGEMGLAGWTVQLFWSGQLVSSATTEADGSYILGGLANGTTLYEVCVVVQAPYAQTGPVGGSGCGGNGYAVPSFNSTIPGTTVPLNFGMMLP